MALGTGIVGFFDKKESEKAIEKVETIAWTCSVHPEIQQDKPGLCPECDIELTTKK